MEDCLDGFSENILEWESIRHMTELDLDDPLHIVKKVDHRIHRFPRQDFLMYGMIPKMEQRTYIKCRGCKLIFTPFRILYHKSCVSIPTSTIEVFSEKKTKNRNCNSRRNRGPNKDKESFTKVLKITNQVTNNSIIQETNVNSDPEIKKINTDAPSPSCLSSDSLTFDCDSSSPMKTSSRSSKKSRKGKLFKEFDPDLHCGVVDAHKGPCLRSITCSNHRIQLKKIVPGRSKDIHQLIAEKRLAKERDFMSQANTENYRIDNDSVVEQVPILIAGNFEEINEMSTSAIFDIKENIINNTDEIDENKEELKHPIELTEVFQDQNHLQDFKYTSNASTPNESIKTENFDFSVISPVKEGNYFTTFDNLRFTSRTIFNPQESIHFLENFDFTELTPMSSLKDECDGKMADTIGLAQILPMSPLEQESSVNQENFVSDSVINIPMIEHQASTFKIPDLEVDISRGSYPRAMAVPNYGMKKIGGGNLFDKFQLQLQRNDILRAVNDSRINYSLFDESSFSKTKRNCNVTLNDSDIEYKQMRLDPNLNHFLMQCEIKKPFDDVLLDECLQENFGRNTFTSTIDFE